MKKNYFFGILLSAVCVTGFAQSARTVDLSLRMVSPTNGMTYNAATALNVDVWVKNNGPDNLIAGDTIFVLEYVGSTLLNVRGMVLGASGAPATLNAGDSTEITYSTGFQNGTSGTTAYCNAALASHDNDITESQTQNNSACAMLNYNAGPVGVKEFSKIKGGFTVMPNPASDAVTLTFSSSKDQAATTEIYDVTGKLVSSAAHSISFGEQTITLSVADLKPGIYSVQLITSEGRSAMKLVVSH